jgi:cellulose 1,4-beta-cellobiosidase
LHLLAPVLLFTACASSSSDSTPGGGDPGSGGSAGSSGSGGAGGGTSGGGTSGGGTSGGGTVDTHHNPYSGAQMYLNPDYVREVESSISMDPADAALLGKMRSYPTAIWLDSIARVDDLGRYLDDAEHQQATSGKPVVTTFVIYDLPDRDCAALASNGELSSANGGLATYKSSYIDRISAQFAAHPDQRIVGIVEPDSLPNIATNLNLPRCAAAEQTYRDGVAYAISKLSAPNVSLYLDAAHAGWLGWPDNMTKISNIFRDVLAAAGGADKIRGFATDTANYTELHAQTELYDYQYNPCHDELTYVQKLTDALAQMGIANKGFMIDTSRNGLGGIRHLWGSWCNVHGAGLGERPIADPQSGIDAFFWIKPPGESDGTSDPGAAPRFDAWCANQDATPGAPKAGEWFHPYFVNLVKNANPPL